MAFIVSILALMTVSWISARRNRPKYHCVNNLKNVGLAFQIFATDNEGALPSRVSTNEGGSREWLAEDSPWRQFAVLSNELSIPGILKCPNDGNRRVERSWTAFRDQNLSYFVNIGAESMGIPSVLSGDRNLVVDDRAARPGRIVLKSSAGLAWGRGIHNRAGNVVMADGGVRQLNSADLKAVFWNPSSGASNILLVP